MVVGKHCSRFTVAIIRNVKSKRKRIRNAKKDMLRMEEEMEQPQSWLINPEAKLNQKIFK